MSLGHRNYEYIIELAGSHTRFFSLGGGAKYRFVQRVHVHVGAPTKVRRFY